MARRSPRVQSPRPWGQSWKIWVMRCLLCVSLRGALAPTKYGEPLRDFSQAPPCFSVYLTLTGGLPASLGASGAPLWRNSLLVPELALEFPREGGRVFLLVCLLQVRGCGARPLPPWHPPTCFTDLVRRPAYLLVQTVAWPPGMQG